MLLVANLDGLVEQFPSLRTGFGARGSGEENHFLEASGISCLNDGWQTVHNNLIPHGLSIFLSVVSEENLSLLSNMPCHLHFFLLRSIHPQDTRTYIPY